MITRRQAIKLAASLAAARGAAPLVDRAEAATLLDQPIDAGTTLPPVGTATPFAHPVAFVDDLSRRDIDPNAFNYLAPDDYAAYVQARAGLLRALPILNDVGHKHPYNEMDEAVYALANECYFKGLADGAAYEHLRATLTGATRVCVMCDGIGSLSLAAIAGGTRFRDQAGGPDTCPDCNGQGVTPNR